MFSIDRAEYLPHIYLGELNLSINATKNHEPVLRIVGFKDDKTGIHTLRVIERRTGKLLYATQIVEAGG